jgi:hypothetical protein
MGLRLFLEFKPRPMWEDVGGQLVVNVGRTKSRVTKCEKSMMVWRATICTAASANILKPPGANILVAAHAPRARATREMVNRSLRGGFVETVGDSLWGAAVPRGITR